MKKVYLIMGTLTFLGINHGCRQELIASEQSMQSNIEITDGYVKNGRLYFANKESLQHYYDNVKNENEEIIAKYIDSKGLISLRPIVTEQNEKLILAQTQARINSLKEDKLKLVGKVAGLKNATAVVNDEQIKDDIDDLEDIIGDDAFAAFLNNIGKPKPNNNVTYSYSVPEFGKLYIHKMFYRKENNVSHSERTFDWGFQIGFNIGSDGSISPNTSASGLIRPKGYKVKMYGIAKKNGAWHGSKIDTFK